MQFFILLFILVSLNLFSHEHRYDRLDTCKMLGGASSLFPECYKYKNLEKSEIFVKNVINEYEQITNNYLDSSENQSNKIEFWLKKNFNIQNITNCSLGEYHIKILDKPNKYNIEKLIFEYLLKIFLLTLQADEENKFKVVNLKSNSRKFYVKTIFHKKSSTRSYLEIEWITKVKRSKHQIVDLSFNQKSLCSTIGLIVKSSLHLEGIGLVKKKLKQEIKNLEMEYNKIKKKGIFFIYPYLITIENNIQL